MNADELPAEALTLSDDESRAAMRAYLQRSEVRLSTIHRVAQALLGGSALVLLLPLFIRDGFPKMMTLVIASYDAGQPRLLTVTIGLSAALVILLPLPAIFLLMGDLLGFYFTSNTFGAFGGGGGRHNRERRVVFNPRFIIPGLGFNNDELSPATRDLLAEGREDEWTRALLVPHSVDDAGWRERFDTRTLEIWGFLAKEGEAGDRERLRQQFRHAGLNRDRTLARDVARTEALMARHVLQIRTVVLRYSKASLLLITTTVATLAASGLVEQAIREDPTGGKFTGGFPYRYLFLVALVFVGWAPLAARAVTSPLRMIQRHTPGVGKLADVYRDRETTHYEAITVTVTAVVLAASALALVVSGHRAGGGEGLAFGIVFAVLGLALWVMALHDYRATPLATLNAVWLLLRGLDAPTSPGALRAARAETAAAPRVDGPA